MATASIDPLHFFMQVQPSMLVQYAASYGVQFKTEQTTAGEEGAEEFMRLLQSLPEPTQKTIWGNFYDIDSVASKTGCEYLFNRASNLGKKPNEEEFNKLDNDKERAIYFYLYCKDIFSDVTVEYNIDNLQGWRRERTVCKTIEEITKNTSALGSALKAFYNEEYRGNQITIKTLEKPDRTIFTAYVEDTYTNDVLFEKDGSLNSKATRRPVFSIYFLYRPQEGILEVKAPGGGKRIQDLHRIFTREMLHSEPLLQDTAQFDFEKIKNLPDLDLSIYATDEVERVTLCGLRLVDNNTKATHTIDIGNHSTTGTEPMVKILREKHIDLNDFRITQFKIEVIFKKLSKGRAKKVTVKVSHPNICDLKERPIDYTVRELLKRWKLDLL